MKKNLIQSMLTHKLSTATNLKVKVKEPAIKLDTKQSSRLLTYSSNPRRTSYGTNYVPKYRKPLVQAKLRKGLEKVQKVAGKENVSRNAKLFSPIISMSEKDSDDGNVDYDTPRLKECDHIEKYTESRNHTQSYCNQLNNSDIQKLIKINLDLVQTLAQSLEASRSLVSVLTNSELNDKDELNRQIKMIENLSYKNKASECLTEINGVLHNLNKKPKPLR